MEEECVRGEGHKYNTWNTWVWDVPFIAADLCNFDMTLVAKFTKKHSPEVGIRHYSGVKIQSMIT